MKGQQRKVTRRGQRLYYPWEEMQRGDWFDVPASMVCRDSVNACASKKGALEVGARYEVTTLLNHRGRPVTRVMKAR